MLVFEQVAHIVIPVVYTFKYAGKQPRYIPTNKQQKRLNTI